MITIVNFLAFLAGLLASVPPFYFFKKLYRRNKYYAIMSFLLALTFVFHAFYHLFSGVEDLLLLSEILETFGTLFILIYVIMYTSNGGENKL